MTSEEVPENTEATENTEASRWGILWSVVGLPASGVAGFLITPYMQVGNDLKAHAIYACMAMTLYLFVLLLIYLEELSGYLLKISNPIKNFALNIWQKFKSIKKPLKTFTLFAGLTLLIAAELFLIYKTFKGFSDHATEIKNLPNDFNFSLKSDELSKIQSIRFNAFLCALGVLFLPALPASFFAKKIKSTLEKHILRTFVLTVIIGGILAFLIPTFLYNYGFIGDTKDLTTALLGVTGGVVALFSLIKSHQKSELEREQLEVQKQKDSRDHIRQLHNSYSDRFDKAVTELNSGESKDAFAAVYKLVHLADDWLEYKDLSDDKEEQNKLKNRAQKETQTIIDILCKYIRTMPGEYTEEDLKDIGALDTTDQDKLKNESEVRRLIFSEISDRSSAVTIENDKISTTPGVWSDFDFDFSRAPIFYSLDNLTIEKGNFSEANFYGDQNFENVKFAQDADFSGAEFRKFATDFKVEFSSVIFAQEANFSGSTFENKAVFLSATFGGRAEFSGTTFTDDAVFSAATFVGFANFSAFFQGEAEFRQVTFKSATFSGATFDRNASFSGKTTFGGIVNFRGAPFSEGVFFNEVTFEDEVYFSGATFTQNAQFIKATFAQKADFSYATFKNYEPLFARGEERAKFSVRPSREDYIFSVSSGSKPIPPGVAELDGIERQIPVGTVLFDPDSGRTSEPAKPIEESDSQGENPSR
ncbi:pentapeptide repeat-containing protein [uncultured Rothia sp.]|uniref:pentapeptide repeat-containing protein n=1 Tax=uncultured Rothia sp. TaxID=316088 RepID=UPI0028D7FC3F|nr:pentapeptide repeat-containing protein [uncultured Rothia sp.]